MYILICFNILGDFSLFLTFLWQFTISSILFKKMFLLTPSIEYLHVLITQVSGWVLLLFNMSQWMYMREVWIQPSYTDGEYKVLQWLIQSTELSSQSELRFGGGAGLCLFSEWMVG